MFDLVLAVTLSWSVPRYQSGGAFVTYVPKEARVYRHRQSQAWVAMHPAMQLDGDVWAAMWPTVRWEARAVRVATIPLSAVDCGRRLTWSTPDTSVATFYYVTTVDTSGSEAIQSNEVGR